MTAVASSGIGLAPQILAAGGGPINISNLTLDGGLSNISCNGTLYQIGVAYRGASGSVNHLAIRNQTPGGCGYAFWAESAGATETLTIENSSFHNFDAAGVSLNLTGGSLTATVQSNWLRAAQPVRALGSSFSAWVVPYPVTRYGWT